MVDSVPEFVMRTGVLAPFSPMNVRQDVQESHIDRITNIPVGREGTMGYFGDYEDFGMAFAKEDVKFFAVGSVAGAALSAGIGAMFSKRGNRSKGAMYGALGGLAASLTALVVNRAIR